MDCGRGNQDRAVATRYRDRHGKLGLEEQVRFATFDGLRKEAPALEAVSATPVMAGCRMIKSPAEIALLQRANDITIEAYKAALATLREGMSQRDLSANISAAFHALGTGGGAMAIFGKYTAFPHGSIQPQQLREGDMVLIDDGCTRRGLSERHHAHHRIRQADPAAARRLGNRAAGAGCRAGGRETRRGV